jgi:hypothetical protein
VDETHLEFVAAMIREFPSTVVARLSTDGKFPVQSFDKCVAQNEKAGVEDRVSWVRRWFGKGASVGLILHRADIWVLDLDMAEGWPGFIHDVVKQLEPPQVATPRGGCHFYGSTRITVGRFNPTWVMRAGKPRRSSA